MAAGIIVVPSLFPARDRNGRLVAGALMEVRVNRTTTKATVFTDSALTTPLANPVIANSSGSFPIVWAQAGTAEAPTLYTIAMSGPGGVSIGNPAVFHDRQPSLNAEAANAALAAQAAEVAADALRQIQQIAVDAEDAPSVLNKADLNFGNVTQPNIAVTEFTQGINRYGDTDPPQTFSADVTLGVSSGTHTTARATKFVRMIAQGAGGNGPDQSDTALVVSAYKDNWFLTNATGEMGGIAIDVRNGGDGDSDTSAILINVQAVEGSGEAFGIEGNVSILDDTTAAEIQTVRFQAAVLDATSPYMVGWYTNKEDGAGGDAFVSNQLGGLWGNAFVSLAPGGAKANWLVNSLGDMVVLDNNGVDYFDYRNDDGVVVISRNGGPALLQVSPNGTVGFNNPSTAWTPAVTAGSGTITTVGATDCRYRRVGGMMFVDGSVAITTNGTGGDSVRVTLPVSSARISHAVGREDGVSGAMLQGQVGAGSNLLVFRKYDGSYPGANGAILRFTAAIPVT